ncbi:bifunctional 2-polyprenyl-6-hydroxyphenol methylase/3-demethylubiquinol 3-O-methyltransferase UbiG [Fluviispira sanaruensis]|uniref:3-demethylubiquinone-9 3-O-methyltransferase n=1 Tax=Fluviispira sanaruensis TaxID=2493639 RepID=A0A4P2VJI3_FLUSA|nr:bifunctional 2-polyprenyl-6-hydroxyphenol methylase/3-demethylubiquinol 3-O-methyltransferase UbiG [Fluviispira sanaruensis]BBH51740.1 3-demethylubiquinone-9 3-O-methyltransferase [Fluviispira sanaruensis]
MLKKYQINNEIYKQMGDEWYVSDNYVALLRAEARARNPWVSKKIIELIKKEDVTVLDVGCGGGLLANDLAKMNYKVTGVDIHQEVLNVGKKYDSTGSVKYLYADAHALPFPDACFDVVCILDVLEHVDNYIQVLNECVRCLKNGGYIFYHTFNRNIFSLLFVIKGMEIFVKNTPKNLHVHHLFIKPKEIKEVFKELNCKSKEIKGLNPKIFSREFMKLILKGEIDEKFEFELTNSLIAGYIGYAEKLN